MSTRTDIEKAELELREILHKAEGLIKRDQADETLSFNKSFVDEIENLYKQLETFDGLMFPTDLVNTCHYVKRYFAETLFIAGRKVRGIPLV